MNDKQHASEALSDYRTELTFMTRLHSRLPETPPIPITFPALVGRTFDENFLSDYLAYILNPELNGMGSQPLQAILELAGFDGSTVEFDDVSIKREHKFQDSTRIDFLITVDDSLLIGIENKVMAPNGPRQTEHYAECIKREHPEKQLVMILLARGTRGAPSEDFTFVSYRALLMSFRSIQYDWIKDARRSFIWEDFLTHLTEHIAMGGDQAPPSSEKSRLYLEHRKVIDDCADSFDADSRRLYDYLTAKIRSRFAEPEWVHERHQGYQLIYRPTWTSNEYRVFFVAHLTKGVLGAPWFRVSLDVQGIGAQWDRSPHTKRMMDLFESMHPSVVAQVKSSELQYRSDERTVALVTRRYPMHPAEADADFIDKTVSEALEEFMFLCIPMGEAWAAYEGSEG